MADHDAEVTSQPTTTMSLSQIQHLMDQQILPDEQHGARGDDIDSAYGSASLIGEDTETLASYITDFRYENGRRYHSFRDGSYWGPNDESGNSALTDLTIDLILTECRE
jgi:hypothetical protein